MEPADLAYVAAIIDTRANLTSRKVESAVLPQVDVNGGPLEVLEWLGTLTGVRVVPTERDYARSPCAEHCTTRHQHIVSRSGRWSVSGAKATIILAAVLPYVRFRREEIEENVRLGRAAKYKGATVVKMRALGWPVPEEMCSGNDR